MNRVKPYFLITKWEDGSVSRLLRQNHLEFASTSFGYLGRAKPMWTLVNVLQMPWLFATVISAYLRRRCKIILVLNLLSFVNALPPILLLRYLGRARVSFYLGDIPTNNAANRVLARLANAITERVIANSNAVRNGLVAIGIDDSKIRVIYNGVDVTRFEEASPKGWRDSLGWPSQTILVGYVGQFSPNKGGMDFVRAAELVLDKDPRCRFVMVGGVDEEVGYQREIAAWVREKGLENRVTFTGWIDDMEETYAALDVVVVPSRHPDAAPNVNIEAMASGTPVVATRVGGTPELVVDGESGFLVERESPEQIAQRVLQLAGDVELRQRMGSAGRKTVHQMFDVRKNALLVEEALLSE
jgi:glycosyltransferase involved in cell wall biosynthesis